MRTASDAGRCSKQAPVWEMVEVDIRSGGAYARSFDVLLTVAGVIGAVGILTKSQIPDPRRRGHGRRPE